MALKDLDIKNFYSPNRSDDFLDDLYIPSLFHSTIYKRLSGYFSSTALAESARGLKHFVLNKGKMQMVLGVIIKEQDQEAIKNASDPTKMIEDYLNFDFDELSEEDIRKKHIRVLGWMMKEKLLEMKIAVVRKPGIFHMKIGIF